MARHYRHKTHLVTLLSLLVCIVSLAACGGAPTPASVAPSPLPQPPAASQVTSKPRPTTTPQPTAIPQATSTPRPTATPEPTPAPRASELREAAASACEGAGDARVAAAPPSGRVLALRATGAETKDWQIVRVPHLSAETAPEVGTLVCISETRRQEGSYQDGEAAYRLIWTVRLVSWPDKVAIGARTLKGSAPPFVKFEQGPGVGREPSLGLLRWLLESGLDDGSIIEVGDDTTALAFSPDNKLLAAGHTMLAGVDYDSGESGSTVTLHDVSTRKRLAQLRGHSDRVTSVAFSPDGRTLASGSRDKTVRLWNVSRGAALKTFKGPDSWVTQVAFSPDGQQLVAGYDSNRVVVWDLAKGDVLAEIDEAHGAFAFSKDGRSLLLVRQNNLVVYDLASLQQARALSSFDLVQQITLRGDGELLALGWYDEVSILTAEHGSLRHALRISDGSFVGMGFVANGALVTASAEGVVTLWDAERGVSIQARRSHAGTLSSLAVSSDGTLMATGGDDETVRIWKVSAGGLSL